MKHTPGLPGPNCPLPASLLRDIGARAHEASIRAITGGFHAKGDGLVFFPDGTDASAQQLAAPLVAFAAARLLQIVEKDAKVVAGAAIWSVGPNNRDTLDHGIARSSTPSLDAALGDFHTWIVCEGWLFDFAARTLPEKLASAHKLDPFSTPPRRWTRFPKVIAHDMARRMPNPVNDLRVSYGYFERGPELLAAVGSRHRLVVREAELWATRLSPAIQDAVEEP